MPFVKEIFTVEKPIKAFVYVMHTLGYTQGAAQRHISKGRILINGVSMFRPGNMIEGEIEMVFFRGKSQGETPLFHNKDFMVFEKPSGVLVHPKTMSTPYS
ncbi:MAG TPA: RNA pseudouridine synthase, partial [Epsilonproteobacteria bacterium]|nr:RNA pseudouridine synthase [Campylobacterota bacterium]